MRILVLASQENTRLDTLLSRFDWRKVLSCDEAIVHLKKQNFDLVFVDMDCDISTIPGSNISNLSNLDESLLQEVVRQKLFSRTLQRATTLLNKSLESHQFLDEMLALIDKLVPCDTISVLLIENHFAHVVQFYGKKQPELQLNLHTNADLQTIIDTERPLLIPDTAQFDTWSRPDVKSYLGVPLRIRDEIVGVFKLESHREYDFTTSHAEWLAVFAELVSMSIYNSRLYHEKLRYEQEVAALRQTSEIISSTLKQDKLIDLILAHLKKVVHYDNVAICLMEAEQFEIVAVRGFSRTAKYIGRHFNPRQHTLFRELIKTDSPVASINAQSDSRFDDWDKLEYKRSWLVVPLNTHSSIIGCMIMSSEKIGVYGQAEINLVESFANQTSMAIYNAQLFEEVRRYTIELENRVEQRTAELREANEEIKRSETRYRTLFEASFEAICVHDKGVILDANPAFEAMFGRTLDELTGTNVLELVVEESKEEVLDHIRTGNENAYEAKVIRKDGQVFPVELIGKQYLYQGHLVRVTALRELTQRIELAIEREKTQILSEFITQASHEFRTPLSLIKTQSYLLKKTLETEKQFDRIDLINKQADYITKLISNMVFLSKLDSDAQLFNYAQIDINRIIEGNQQTISDTLGEKQIELQVEYKQTSLMMKGDSRHLHIAVNHILENAIQHTEPGDKISMQCDKHEDYAIVKIEDTGTGMSSDVLLRIFERFYRADVSGTNRGFGLGLSIARQIIERHGGKIEVESQVDQGSTFTIWLPL